MKLDTSEKFDDVISNGSISNESEKYCYINFIIFYFLHHNSYDISKYQYTKKLHINLFSMLQITKMKFPLHRNISDNIKFFMVSLERILLFSNVNFPLLCYSYLSCCIHMYATLVHQLSFFDTLTHSSFLVLF